MNPFEQRKRAEKREAIVLIVNMIFWVAVGIGALQLLDWPW